jgi:Zn-dependent peptidase ImmA (M78 family)
MDELSTSNTCMLTVEQYRFAKKVFRDLLKANKSVDSWVKSSGFNFYRLNLPSKISGAFLGSFLDSPTIILNEGLSWLEEVATVAHEFCHAKFHKSCIAYRDLSKEEYQRDETNAELFSIFVIAFLTVRS